MFFTVLSAQDLSGYSLIAHYPLDTDSLDATGLNGPIYLFNAPHQDGGVYVNGIYIGSGDPNASEVTTPRLNGFKFEYCAIQLEFKVDSLIDRPLFTLDIAWRAMGVWLNGDGGISAIYNDIIAPYNLNIQYSPNQWHVITVLYDSTTSMGHWYLDGTEFFNHSFTIQHGSGKEVTMAHGGIGMSFKGILGDLKVYSEASNPTGIQNETNPLPASFDLGQNYPNPFNPVTNIQYSLNSQQFVTLNVIDPQGSVVKTLVNERKPAGSYTVQWDGTNNAGQSVASGVYLYRMKTAGTMLTRKMILLR
jgi:hypothetical protein